MNKKHITSHYPYLMRGMYEWMVDNDLTPYIEVDTKCEGVKVPPQFIKEGKILLNIAPRAVNVFSMDNDAIKFEARFGKIVFPVYVPMAAIRVIFAHEMHVGMVFYPEQISIGDSDDSEVVMSSDFLTNIMSPMGSSDNPTFKKHKPQKSRAKLKLVKSNDASSP
jgi:stringent starvation protein B